MSQDLASSCLTCRKRQVRCDGNKPTCTRCPKDGRPCRGYKGQMRIVQVDPTKKPQAVSRKSKQTSEAATCTLTPRESTQPPETMWTPTLPIHIFVGDKDFWTIADCARYWNTNIIPSTFPAERPFFRATVSANDIAIQPLPKVCLHLVIVAFRSTQAARLLIDPFAQPDLCYYRGLALRELPEHLENAATDPWGIALISIVMLMASDLLVPDSSWLSHLDAARQIVTMRGGVASCMGSLPDSRFILVQFLNIDTLTSTTCCSAKLPQASFSEMIGEVENIDFQLIACASACPAEILKLIARTSTLRRQCFDNARSLCQAGRPVSDSEYDVLLDGLKDFDCTAWAIRMAHLKMAYPLLEASAAPCSSLDGLASVAECYRSAALLYLLLSCGPSSVDVTLDQVRLIGATLHREIHRLFSKASEHWHKPLDTQLWKFVTWPLVMAAYVWVGWDVVGTDIQLETLFERLDKISLVKGVWARSNAEHHLREVQARRAERPRARWTWDMGFSERRSFVL